MTKDNHKIIKNAIAKIKRLEEENLSLKESISSLKQIEQKYTILQKDYERLKLAKAFGHSEEDKKRAYRRLSNMIAEIDRCLKLLND